jgi:hypothetical protein
MSAALAQGAVGYTLACPGCSSLSIQQYQLRTWIATQPILCGDKTLVKVQGCDYVSIGRRVLGTSGRSSLHNRVSTCLA